MNDQYRIRKLRREHPTERKTQIVETTLMLLSFIGLIIALSLIAITGGAY